MISLLDCFILILYLLIMTAYLSLTAARLWDYLDMKTLQLLEESLDAKEKPHVA